MSIGTFTLIKNEIAWIRPHVLSLVPFVDEMVFFDGNSTDGTLEAIKDLQRGEHGQKIKLVENKDPKDLQDDYVRLFNECLRTLSIDLAWFCHPDMVPENPEQILKIKDSQAIAMATNMTSYAGEPGGQLYRIEGRADAWKNIYRLRNPDLGAHYWGHYGHDAEDVYFSEITGKDHVTHNRNFQYYPYPVVNSGIRMMHFSDVRPYERRYNRMVSCLINQGHEESEAQEKAKTHPRVTLAEGHGFSFSPAEYPHYFTEAVK